MAIDWLAVVAVIIIVKPLAPCHDWGGNINPFNSQEKSAGLYLHSLLSSLISL